MCETIANSLDKLPGDSRTMIGFITFNSSVHFYSLKVFYNFVQVRDFYDPNIPNMQKLIITNYFSFQATQSQPQMFIVSDIDGKSHTYDCIKHKHQFYVCHKLLLGLVFMTKPLKCFSFNLSFPAKK